MNTKQLDCIDRKNRWLHDLVEVEFPTKESLEGRKLYFQRLEQLTYQEVDPDLLAKQELILSVDDIFRVDFHRLTVMYAILQSHHWVETREQELIVEYLSQIILTSDIDLYVGFKEGEPVGAAMICQDEETLLISDVITTNNLPLSQFVGDLIRKITSNKKLNKTVILES
ncbi:flavodoxin [Vibrio azureus]|uniref:Flavodoxin n=1 Tax=Vibrio azureus NBRC 104587 TaxID=1219077 RepID=U3C690_9VIBR|nr:hypothetical protein [Vibrio azureus]AUI88047.1 flavodoxin [Vibrio azureus]GAD76909.1 hypothetical protein VAZ01S_055_00350 [Vibrio azureus NBRC 104587]